MSKRRKKNKPNLPQATLDRARRQAGLDPEETNEEDGVVAEASADDASAKAEAKPSTKVRSSSASRRRKTNSAQLERSRKRGEVNHEMMQELLHNPTIEVSEAELAKEYNHVLLDLRNMGVLAAILMVVLVGLAQFI